MLSIPNLLTDVPGSLPDELIETIVSNPTLRIERIISRGHASPKGFWYDQAENEFVVLLQGAARLQFENEAIEMKAGSFIHIPAHRRHRVEWTTLDEPTIWLAIFFSD